MMLQNDMNPPWSTHPERPMNEWPTLLVEAESILGANRLAAIFTGPWLVPVRVSLAAWRCCSSVRHEGYERLIVALHQESAPWRFQHHADRRGHRHTRATGRWRQPPSTPPPGIFLTVHGAGNRLIGRVEGAGC